MLYRVSPEATVCTPEAARVKLVADINRLKAMDLIIVVLVFVVGQVGYGLKNP